MKANHLQKAAVLLKEIHELDAQLIQLDKKAMSIVEGEKYLSIEISFDKDKPEEPAPDPAEEYGLMARMLYYTPRITPVNTDKHKLKISDTECLVLIGALIQCKKEYRRTLCDKIVELGVYL